MNKMMKWGLAGILGLALAGASLVHAQSTLGGAKLQQNKIGGAAKPPPAIGGAPPKANYVAPKPGPAIATIKPNTPGGTPVPGSTGSNNPGPTANNARSNPPVTPPNKGGTVVSNMKCSAGVCTSKGAKP